MNNSLDLFSQITEENGVKFIDLDQNVDKYELLGMLFHNPTLKVDVDKSFLVSKNDKKRYFEDSSVCFNCGEIGHVVKDCVVVKSRNCMYCDINHDKKPCDYLLCDNCFHLGHTAKFCRSRPYVPIICKNCPTQYHYTDECPKIWRVYKMQNGGKKNKLIMSCPYCHSDNHFMDDCDMKDRRFSIFTKNFRNLNKRHKR